MMPQTVTNVTITIIISQGTIMKTWLPDWFQVTIVPQVTLFISQGADNTVAMSFESLISVVVLIIIMLDDWRSGGDDFYNNDDQSTLFKENDQGFFTMLFCDDYE